MRELERSHPMDVFHILADPTKRKILDLVREREWSVGELVDYFQLPQPAVSKHLRALREAHMVEVRVDGQRRWYRLRAESLAAVGDWIEPYRRLWSGSESEAGRSMTMCQHSSEAD